MVLGRAGPRPVVPFAFPCKCRCGSDVGGSSDKEVEAKVAQLYARGTAKREEPIRR